VIQGRVRARGLPVRHARNGRRCETMESSHSACRFVFVSVTTGTWMPAAARPARGEVNLRGGRVKTTRRRAVLHVTFRQRFLLFFFLSQASWAQARQYARRLRTHCTSKRSEEGAWWCYPGTDRAMAEQAEDVMRAIEGASPEPRRGKGGAGRSGPVRVGSFPSRWKGELLANRSGSRAPAGRAPDRGSSAGGRGRERTAPWSTFVHRTWTC